MAGACDFGEIGQANALLFQGRANSGAGKNRDFALRLQCRWVAAKVGCRMEVYFGQPRPQMRDYSEHVIVSQMTALMETEEPIGRADAAGVCEPSGAAREGAEDAGLDDFARGIIAGECERGEYRLARQPNAWDTVLDAELEEEIGDDRMDVKVEVAVDMVEASDQFHVQFDLRADLVAQAVVNSAIEKVAQAGANRAVEKIAGCVNEAGELIRWQRAPTATDDQVEADVKVGIFAREGGGFVARRGRYHQAGRGKDALAMRADNAGVNLARVTEVIGGDDDGALGWRQMRVH